MSLATPTQARGGTPLAFILWLLQSFMLNNRRRCNRQGSIAWLSQSLTLRGEREGQRPSQPFFVWFWRGEAAPKPHEISAADAAHDVSWLSQSLMSYDIRLCESHGSIAARLTTPTLNATMSINRTKSIICKAITKPPVPTGGHLYYDNSHTDRLTLRRSYQPRPC